MFRATNPSDLSGIFRFAARFHADMARPRRRLGRVEDRTWAAGAIIARWFSNGSVDHTYLWTHGGRSGGLASVRTYRGYSTCEVDRLLASPAEGKSFLELLSRLDTLCVQGGMDRIFLRLPSESQAVTAAHRSGYEGYLHERVYVLPRPSETPQLVPSVGGLEVRSRQPQDDYALFRLYNASAPLAIRRAEGMTFREWREADLVRWQGQRRNREVIVHRGGAMLAWARVAKGGRGTACITVLGFPEARDAVQIAVLQALGIAGLRRLSFLVPDHVSFVGSLLEDMGFVVEGEYVSLIRRIRARFRKPAFRLARAALVPKEEGLVPNSRIV